MTQLPTFTPALDERLTAEFLALSLTLLAFPPEQDQARLDALAWQLDRPEPPRDPDLPLLPPKDYPRIDPALVEDTIRALQPPPPVAGFSGRRTELDQAVTSLINGRPVVISGESGIGKTALLRQIAADSRIRSRFRRVWWFDSLDAIGDAIGLALELPHVLRLDPAVQPDAAREFLDNIGVLLLIDSVNNPAAHVDIDYALRFGAGVAVISTGDMRESSSAVVIALSAEAALVDRSSDRNSDRDPERDSLLAKIGGNPRTLKLVRALLDEDNLPPELVAAFIRTAPMLDLFSASFAALPDQYQAAYRMFPAGQSVALETALSAPIFKNNRLAAYRALTFLERHGFLERIGDAVRAITVTGADLPPNVSVSAVETLAPIVFPARDFRVRSESRAPDDPREQAHRLHEEGIEATDQARDHDAELLLNQALSLRQEYDHAHAAAETLTALARLAYLQGDDANAIRRLESAAELLHSLRDDESLNVVRIALSRVYRRSGRFDAALSVLGDDGPAADLGMIYADRGDWEAAILAFSRPDQRDSETAHYGLSYALLCAGRPADALQAVANADESDFNARFTRGLVYHMQGDFDRALQAYDRADTVAVRNADRGGLARARGRALATSGRYREAAIRVGAEGTWFEAKLARPIFARQQSGHALYATLMLAQNNVEEAEAAARRALDTTDERPQMEAIAAAHHVIGRLCVVRGDVDGALSAFSAALEAREAFAVRDEPAIGLTLHAIADAYAARGDYERAVANLRRALSHFSETPDERRPRLITLLALRDGLIRIGRAADAIEIGDQMIDLLSKRPEADLQLLGYAMALQTQLLLDAGRESRARQLFTDWQMRLARRAGEAFDHRLWGVQTLAIGLIVRSVTPVLSAQSAYSGSLLYNLAEEALSVAESNAPNTLAALAARRDLGSILIALERWQEARDAFAPLLAETPTAESVETVEADDPLLTMIRLSAHIGTARSALAPAEHDPMRDPAVAAEQFDAAAELEPDSIARGNLIRESAAARSAMGDEDGAAARYLDALTLLDRETALDEHVGALVDLAYVRLRLRRFGAAIETFENALSIVQELPDSILMASVLTDLATAHHTLGQYRRAAATYRRALAYQKAPDRAAETLIALARSSAAMGSQPQALEAYHDALQYELSPAQRRAVLIEQATAHVAIDQHNTAIETYNAALAISGISSTEQAAIRRGLGKIYAIMGAHDNARRNFEQALEAVEDEQTGLTLRAIGDGHRAQKQISAALDAYSRALPYLDRGAFPIDRAAVQRAMGELYLEEGRAAEALGALENALEIERALPQQDGGRIVANLRGIAAAYELRGEIDKAILRHHEALVYQDARHAPDQYAQTLHTLGRLYAQLKHYDEAARALEDALATEYTQAVPDSAAIDAETKLLADVYRAQNRLEQAADLYRRVGSASTARSASAASGVRDDATRALNTTLDDIARHEQTLRAAEQSWALLNRAPNADLKGLIFVLALQAQAYAALGKWDDSEHSLDTMMRLIADRRAEVSVSSRDPAVRIFALLLTGQMSEDAREYERAIDDYRAALALAEQNSLTPALIWALRQKSGQQTERKGLKKSKE